MARIFVSGANGFIGQALTARLLRAGHDVTGGVRVATALAAGIRPLVTGDLADSAPPLGDADVVIHTAGLAHQNGRTREDMERGNVIAAEKLASATPPAARFIFLSSIMVHGRTNPAPITDTTAPAPTDDYARSKLAAEQALLAQLGPRLHIIRPAAVIGPQCPGNISLLLKALRMGLPFPLGAIRNARSFIDIDDLAALILRLVQGDTPKLVLAAHPQPISTPDLIRALASGLNRPARLLPVPLPLMALAARATGKSRMWQSLSGNLVVKPQAALSLGWSPAQELALSFKKTAEAS